MLVANVDFLNKIDNFPIVGNEMYMLTYIKII